VRTDKKSSQKADKKAPSRVHNRGVVGYSKKSVLLEEAITYMNAGKYGRSSAALKELLSLDPHNTEARRLFATLHLRLGSLVTAQQAFESLANEAIERQDLWLAESLLREYLAAGPRCVPFLELLAHVHDEKGDAMAAVAELGKAIDILLEAPDSENPKKPSQLYAKVRELAPASPVALQFASLFDIQTGELLVSHPPAPAEVITWEVDASSHTQDETFFTTEESRDSSAVMPWEQFDRVPTSQETPALTSSNPVFESLDVPHVSINPAPVGLASQEPEAPASKTAELSQEINCFDQEKTSSILADPPFPLRGHHDHEIGDPIVERSLFFVEEGLTLRSSEELTGEVGIANVSSVGSPGLSSPMPWEQIENTTIRIEETPPSTAPLTQPEGAFLLVDSSGFVPPAITQPEPVSDQLSSSASDEKKSAESDKYSGRTDFPSFASCEIASGLENVAGQLDDKAPAAYFTAPSKTVVSHENWLMGKESAADVVGISGSAEIVGDSAAKIDSLSSVGSGPSISIPDPPVSFSDPEPLPAAHPSILSGVNSSIAGTAGTMAIRESDLPQPTAALLSEASSWPGEPLTFSGNASNRFKMINVPAISLSEPAEPTRVPEPVAPLSFVQPQPVVPFPESSVQEPSRSAVIPEALPAPELASTEHPEIPIKLVKVPQAPPLPLAPSDTPPMDSVSRWSTGEVQVQPHRPSEKKRNWDRKKGETPVDPSAPLSLFEDLPKVIAELSRSGGWESVPSESASVVEVVVPILEKVVPQEDKRPDWARASETITFVSTPPSPSEMEGDSGVESTHSKPESAVLVAASDVDALFGSTGEESQVSLRGYMASPRPRSRIVARMGRFRIGISLFIGSCFSTTRSIVLLCVGLALSCIVLMTVGIGAVGLAWMVMEVPPSPTYQNLTASPPPALTDSTKNGYFLLLGFDVSGGQDPLRAGYEREVEKNDLQAASACMLGNEGRGTTIEDSANVVHGWFTSADPVAQLKPQAASVRSWAAQESLALKRYQQWLLMPFEDAGYGQILSPNCGHILLAHRLYLAEGFAQDLNTGLGRLENDMGSWRTVLEQSKTLMVKMLAATAVQDDVAVASGLLTRQDLDETAINRLGMIVRPLDQVELSLQWPMQSHLVWATKALTKSLRNDKADERPLYIAVAAAMPLPIQRRSNAYADYYEAASKAVAEGRYTNLPKPSSFIRTLAVSAVDYVANPIEHIIGIEPLPSWDPYVGRTVETDARLRLASLQVWIRQGTQDGNVVTRLAKAGQALYDPFTGLPMLVDQRKGVMYSVGQDGKDQEGDPQRDVVATIPKTHSTMLESSRSVSPPRSK
jgi:hypothetical protein